MDMCIDMHVDMCADMHVDMCIDIHTEIHTGMHVDMYTDMRSALPACTLSIRMPQAVWLCMHVSMHIG